MKKIVCESGSERVEFSYSDPLWLEDVSGITESDFVVSTEPLVDAAGETYYGSSMGKREITITANIFDNYVARREQLLSFFQRGKLGTLYFYEDDMSGKKINYYPEKVSFDAIGVVRGVTVSLICPYPLFSDLLPTEISMAYWKPLIRFPFTFSAPFKVGERIKQQLSIVENQSNTQLGLTITFTASGLVSHPTFKNLTSGKQFRLNASMSAGGKIVVTTGVGVKNAIQTADGDTRYAWSFGDDWVQLEPGHNELWYGADSGEDYLDVKYSYVQEYWGA